MSVSEVLREEFDRDDGGSPLGVGMPSGRPLRGDGESHREGWMSVVRRDPCAYCGAVAAATVDHIEPRARLRRGPLGTFCWINFAAACGRCNATKGDRSLIEFLLLRAWSAPAVSMRAAV